MDTLVDARFVDEAERCQLRFCCEHCAHFDPVTERCGEGFPNEAHRLAPLSVGDRFRFCKAFELGA